MYKQPKRAYFDNASHEFYPPTSSAESSILLSWAEYSKKSYVGPWLRVSCRGQSKVSHIGLGILFGGSSYYRYIHANYRFIVDPKGDYRAQAMDADVHLNWATVLQILVSAQSQSTNCPICLSTPVAPRMAKCGHIFCLPCLIRYMQSTDDSNPIPEKKARWKKCPICWDSVYISETRPVRWFQGQEWEPPREGGDVVLRLITRQLGSILALPRDGAESLERVEDVPWYFAAEVMDYARVMKGSEDYMLAQYDGEIEELLVQEKEDELMFGEETQWTKKAVSAIIDAKVRVKGIGNPPNPPRQPKEKKSKRPPIKFHDNDEDIPDFYSIQHAMKSGQSSSEGVITPQSQTSESSLDEPTNELRTKPSESLPPDLNPSSANHSLPQPSSIEQISSSHSRAKPEVSSHQSQDDTPFFFYEALLHYYLSPLDIRILKAAFGDFASFPSTILPRVERVSTGHIVDDELRRRAKYLAHLPHGCEVGFLECNWTDIVAPEVLQGFSADVERRRTKIREKEVREEKERARAEKEEDDKRWAITRRKRPDSSRGTMSEVEIRPLPRVDEGFDALQTISHGSNSSSPPWSSSRGHSGSAFASLASPSTSPSASRTVWGTTAIVPASPGLPAVPQEHEPSDNDGWLQNWERDLLQEDDLVAQVSAISMAEGSSQAGPTGVSSKKRKGKKITLMTTNARRGA